MEIYVENTLIKLTEEQMNLIKKSRDKRKRCINSFARMLKQFGFKPSKENEGCFEHPIEKWWAEIIDYGNWRCVWMVGKGLPDSRGMPGGWQYSTPKEIEEALIKVYESKNP